MSLPNPSAGVCVGQGLVFLTSGAWPIVHLKSFERVTGPKPEGWLVKTVGALLCVVGATLLSAGLRRRPPGPEAALLGAGSAGALAAVDLWYGGLRHRISPVYLLDALLQSSFVAGWALARSSRRLPASSPQASLPIRRASRARAGVRPHPARW